MPNAERIRENALKASGITGIPAPLLEALTYSLDESQGKYPQHERERAARHLLWMNGRDPRGYEPGGFMTKLLSAWGNADQSNSGRLALAFPVYGDALDQVRIYGYDGLAEWAGIATPEDLTEDV